MAMIGYLGKSADDGIQFVVDSEVFRTPNNMKWGGSARYSTHNRHATHALTEFTGLNPDSFSFDMLLTAELGVDPMDEIGKLYTYERGGEALGLVIGGHAYGKYRWTIKKHDAKIKHTDAMGRLYAVEVSVDLLAYLKGENQNTSSANTSPAEETKPDEAETSGGTTYTVKGGDSLWTIAAQLYGDGSDYSKIYEANRDVIGSNPNLIYPGQTLTIPG